MQFPSPGGRQGVQHGRRDERMSEPDQAGSWLDHPGVGGRGELVGGEPSRDQPVRRGLPQHREHLDRPLDRGRQRGQALSDQAGQGVGDRQRAAGHAGDAAPGQSPADLQGGERVALGVGMNAPQGRPGQCDVQPVPRQPVQRPEANPRHRDDPASQVRAGQVKRQGRVRAVGPDRAEQADGVGVDPAQREAERGRAGPVQPLHVIDHQQDRRGRGEGAERALDGGRDHVRLGRRIRRVLDQQRGGQGPPLRRRQVGQHVVQVRSEQVGQARESEPDVAGSGQRAQYQVAGLPGLPVSLPEQGRLVGPGLAGQDEGGRGGRQRGQEVGQDREFALAAHDGSWHGSSVRRRARSGTESAGRTAVKVCGYPRSRPRDVPAR